MRKIFYLVACLVVFGIGVYAWLVKNAGLASMLTTEPAPAGGRLVEASVVAEVGEERISQDDVEWEYDLVTSGFNDLDTMNAVPNLGGRFDAEMAPLRKEIVVSLIERKVLFRYIQEDKDFRFDDPSRYSSCLTEWQASVQGGPSLISRKGGRERLKARLCERSVLEQYMRERLFAGLKIDEADVVEYYKNHMSEFKVPETVEVRHILLGDEQEARKVRTLATQANFADLARKQSLAPEAAHGGQLPPFAMGSMPTVFDVAFHMKKGEISDVLKSNYGFHIVMLLAKQPRRDLGLEEARPGITSILLKKKQEEAYQQWVDRALATVSVTAPKTTAW